MWNQNASLRIKNVYKHEVITAGLSAEKCKFWSIRAAAEFLEVKLACNLGVPSEGTPEAGSKIVKLVCLFIAEDLSAFMIVDAEIVNLENPGVAWKNK